jgi:hypothetical protein
MLPPDLVEAIDKDHAEIEHCPGIKTGGSEERRSFSLRVTTRRVRFAARPRRVSRVLTLCTITASGMWVSGSANSTSW